MIDLLAKRQICAYCAQNIEYLINFYNYCFYEYSCV